MSTNLAGVVVILGLEDGFYYQLEGVGVRVWELIQTRQRLADLVDRIVAEYDVTRDTALVDLSKLLDDLVAHRLVTIDASNDS